MICKMTEFLVDNIYVRFGGQLFRQMIGIPREQTVPRYWLTCFFIPMKMSFQINSLRRAKESLLGSSIYHFVTLMTLSLSIIKDLRSLFLTFAPKELTISEATESTSVASYLDLLFTRDKSNNITTKLDDKRDAFVFHIVNFPLCQAIFHQHQPMVSMHLSSFAMPVVAQIIVTFYYATGP